MALNEMENALTIALIGGAIYLGYTFWNVTSDIRDEINKDVIEPVKQGVTWMNEQPGLVQLIDDKLGDTKGFIDTIEDKMPPNEGFLSYLNRIDREKASEEFKKNNPHFWTDLANQVIATGEKTPVTTIISSGINYTQNFI